MVIPRPPAWLPVVSGYLLALGDLTMFNAWVEAVASNDQALVAFHENRFGSELATFPVL